MSKDKLLNTIKNYSKERILNEADTRHQLIDVVLHEVLAWPRSKVKLEDYARPGYVDYVLLNSAEKPYLVIEAKREEKIFQLPKDFNSKKLSRILPLSRLLSDTAIRYAVEQARGYSLDLGSEYACATNGHEWIFFRTFIPGSSWDKSQAFVVTDHTFFSEKYTEATHKLGYESIGRKNGLAQIFKGRSPLSRELYIPSEKVPSHIYDYQINQNKLAKTFRPIVETYFSRLNPDNPNFFKQCYVHRVENKRNAASFRRVIEDFITPFFDSKGVKQISVDNRGGELGVRLAKQIREQSSASVVLLFGGKGAGKSTFLARTLALDPPQYIKKHGVVAYVDLLQQEPEEAKLEEYIWKQLIDHLVPKGFAQFGRNQLINFFSEEFETAQKRRLAGLDQEAQEYQIRINDLIDEWIKSRDVIICAIRRYWESQHRGVVLVLDNTDHFPASIQDFCFQISQSIAQKLQCAVVLSIREERFYASRSRGLLDAFHNAGFHISSPNAAEVFVKRLKFIKDLLSEQDHAERYFNIDDESARLDCVAFSGLLINEFSRKGAHLPEFLTACAHGNIRLALELFKGFMLSGYTNTDEMLGKESWNVQVHQVLKPVMIPTRFFYSESTSSIPNAFRVRSVRGGSHFTLLRLLKTLSPTSDLQAAGYISLAELETDFQNYVRAEEELENTIDICLRTGMVESDNRIDEYSSDIDNIRITQFGRYFLSELVNKFAYLDLIATDTQMRDESFANDLADCAVKDFDYMRKSDKKSRIELRLTKVDRYLQYLEEAEKEEKEYFGQLPDSEKLIMPAIIKDYKKDKERVIRSAYRNI